MGQGTAQAVGFPGGSNSEPVAGSAEGLGAGSASGFPEVSGQDVLTGILREGAQRLLAQAVEAEVAAYIDEHAGLRDDRGHRLVVRNGYKEERELQTGLGAVQVRQPRVHDRRFVGRRRVEVHNLGKGDVSADPAGPASRSSRQRLMQDVDAEGQVVERFTSKILPPYLRRTRSIEELIPWLYLKGISTGDFSEALMALLGPDAPGLSASTVVRLKESWQADYEAWSKRSLADKRYVYFWVDGIHFNVRLGNGGEGPDEKRQCILIVMGATPEGRKELVAIQDGYRESEQSWRELLLDLKARGLTEAPKLATGDGALGFWAALPKVFEATREQRCWVHKTANVLDKLPKGKQAKAKGMLHDVWMADTREAAEKAFDLFVETYQAKYPKAAECLKKDRAALLTFYDFPAEHWIHLRTTNPIESTFATVRLRTVRTKGCGSRLATLTMVFRLVQCAQDHWRALNGSSLLTDVIGGIQFVNGLRMDAA
ncbi:MAG: IS256 family transposase [Planctomycetia bacterium]|nr:IS256 family transposase [Planctomycetia bacterium]MBE7455421.1 IS256 family transposase [Planctomycetia bacterium]MBE7458034.1 IS256 family transposase [Planctomycetia bacterium]MBE7458413.1 IS256 family transposase [Planctomycetia bacterium]